MYIFAKKTAENKSKENIVSDETCSWECMHLKYYNLVDFETSFVYFQGFSSISTNSLSLSPQADLITKKKSTPGSPYKSLPALDKHFDQLDRELQEISDSVDVLYQQEDTEIDFLNTFLDYDSISVNCEESDDTSEGSAKQAGTNLHGLPPIIANDLHPRKVKMQERLKCLTSKSKLTMRTFGSRDNLQNMKEGLRKSKERLSYALSPARNRRGSYERSGRLNSAGHNCRT